MNQKRKQEEEVDPDFSPSEDIGNKFSSTSNSDIEEDELDKDEEEGGNKKYKKLWPKKIYQYFPAGAHATRKSQAASLYTIFRGDTFGVIPSRKINKKRVEEVKDGMKNKSAGISKEFWVAKVILDLALKKAKETRAQQIRPQKQYRFTQHINNIRNGNNRGTGREGSGFSCRSEHTRQQEKKMHR